MEPKKKADWRAGAYRRLRAPKLSRSDFDKALSEIIGIHIDTALEIKEIEIEGLKDNHSRLIKLITSSRNEKQKMNTWLKLTGLKKHKKQNTQNPYETLSNAKHDRAAYHRLQCVIKDMNPIKRFYKWIQFKLNRFTKPGSDI